MSDTSSDDGIRLAKIVGDISHPRYQFVFRRFPYFHLRVACDGVDNETGEPTRWQGRKWSLSKHMTDGEVVQTAFLAARVADEHELREQFTYKGETIFNPHYDIDRLVDLRRSANSIRERDEV